MHADDLAVHDRFRGVGLAKEAGERTSNAVRASSSHFVLQNYGCEVLATLHVQMEVRKIRGNGGGGVHGQDTRCKMLDVRKILKWRCQRGVLGIEVEGRIYVHSSCGVYTPCSPRDIHAARGLI